MDQTSLDIYRAVATLKRPCYLLISNVQEGECHVLSGVAGKGTGGAGKHLWEIQGSALDGQQWRLQAAATARCACLNANLRSVDM